MAASGRTAGPEVIWARPERAGRGPRPAHTREEIAEAAVRIADEAGIGAVSMRRVATEVGCATMSLYNYVPRKEDLLDLMVDRAAAEYDLPERPSGDWRADLLGLARQGYALMRRHPWLPGALLQAAAGSLGPNGLRYTEFCLAALADSGLDDGLKLELVSMVNGTVMSLVASEQAVAERARSSGYTAEERRAAEADYFAALAAGGGYPHLARAVTAGAPAGAPGGLVERAVGRILDGYAAAAG